MSEAYYGERIFYKYIKEIYKISKYWFGEGLHLEKNKAYKLYDVMKQVDFDTMSLMTMWNCLFSRYYQSNEINMINNLEQWSLKAEDTDLS